MDRLKRVIDIAIAAPLLLATSPVLLLIGILIRATSRGPAIFSQLRLGRDEVPFRCYKLRTMRQGTPSLPTHEAPVSSVTSIGRGLRRFKIDEFPQLWNVLKGDMSLVGPRPCLPSQADLIAWRRRHGVFSLRPGITGLAQIRNIDMSDPGLCARTDGEYMDSRSLAGDFLILANTVGIARKPRP